MTRGEVRRAFLLQRGEDIHCLEGVMYFCAG
jgi:hypothetical protein